MDKNKNKEEIVKNEKEEKLNTNIENKNKTKENIEKKEEKVNINTENKKEIKVNNENKEEVVKNNTEEKIETKAKNKEKTKGKKGIILKILSTILKILIITIVALTLVFSIRAAVYKKHDIFGYRFHVILSGSMETSINIHDLVITKENPKNLKVGDVIAFGSQDGASVHRIISISTENGETIYKTKGDNNNCEDKEIIKNEDIVGKVVAVVPKVGKTILFLKANIVFILILVIAITIIIILIRRLFEIGRKE